MTQHNKREIKMLEQKAREEHKEAEQARSVVGDVYIQKKFHENRSVIQPKKSK
ncbi:hypothetical protein [Fictibacillus phosphorivorans]|uniref:hypothetical protein n=1 Tax=Fictibacillus phosphorivorans TaxID=1221500 RepID=UPI0012940742|nr:hypothetical protein [Fictibacillus phosphorivorans]